MPTRALALSFTLLLQVVPTMANAGEIHAQFFTVDLKAVRSWSASLGGVVEELWTTPDGGLTAALRPERGPPVLVRFSADGKEAGRTPLQVSGILDGASPLPDGSVMVLTDLEVARVGGDGRVLTRRARTVPGPVGRALGDQGVWEAWPDRLTHLALDGQDATVKLPIREPPKECSKEPKREGGCRWQIETGLLTPLRGGKCLVHEALIIDHDASGPNRTEQAALTILDANGMVRARALQGEVKSSLEWFNFGPSGGNLAGMPGKFSLVRRSYLGRTSLQGVEERGDDLLSIIVSGASTWLMRLGPGLEERWRRDIQLGPSAALSPGWTKGILLFSGQSWLEAFDEQGAPAPMVAFLPKGYDPSKLRNAIGQTPAGEWLLVSY